MAPRKGGDSFLGNVVIDFDLAEQVEDKECLFIDYKGRCMNSFKVNGTAVTDSELYKNQRLRMPEDLLKKGSSNVVEIVF
jgi:hypothetical protein